MNNNEDHFILFNTYCKCKTYNDLFTETEQSEFHWSPSIWYLYSDWSLSHLVQWVKLSDYYVSLQRLAGKYFKEDSRQGEQLSTDSHKFLVTDWLYLKFETAVIVRQWPNYPECELTHDKLLRKIRQYIWGRLYHRREWILTNRATAGIKVMRLHLWFSWANTRLHCVV